MKGPQLKVTEFANLTIHEGRRLLDRREISCLELVEVSLERINQIDGSLHSFVTVTEELALKQARIADKLIASGDAGPLTGIPMQIKDNICTAGVATTCSSRMLEDFVPPYDAHVTGKLLEAGAVLIGKGNMDEFAMGSSTENSYFFPTRNPWNEAKVPGGSSGGPAASVAAGECLFAIGSDTGGSIRQPASFCGVVGLKPTYGLVSRFGLVAFASSLDQIGPITRDVTDAALVLNTIAGHDPRDSTSLPVEIPDYTESLLPDMKGIRVGVPSEYFVDGMEIGVKNAVQEAIMTIKHLGAEVKEASLPHTEYAMSVYYIIAPSEASANLARYDGVKYGFSAQNSANMWDSLEKTRQEGFGPEVKRRIMLGTYALSSGYYDAFYLKAQKVRTKIRQEFDSAFEQFDILVTPTSPYTAFELGTKKDDPVQMYLNDVCTMPANIAGIPGISVPAGMSNSLPVGLQFMSNALGERNLFRAAYAYEQATNWHLMHPEL